MQVRRSISILAGRLARRGPFGIVSIFVAGLLSATASAGGGDIPSRARSAGEIGGRAANASTGAILFARDRKGSDVGPSDLYLVDADGTDLQLFARQVAASRWSPDGASVAYLRDALEIVKSSGGRPVRVSATDVNSDSSRDSFNWSPNSTQLAYANPRGAIYVVGSDGRGRRKLIPRQGNDPALSRTGFFGTAPRGQSVMIGGGYWKRWLLPSVSR